MLRTIAVALIIVWMLGLGADFAIGPFVHVLYAAAVALLVVSLSQEGTNHRMLRLASRDRDPKQGSKQRHKRSTDPSVQPRIPLRSGK